MVTGLAAAVASAVLFGVAAVGQAHTVRGFERRPHVLSSFVADGFRSPRMVAVVLAYFAGWALHAVAIWLLPLYLAQAAVSLSLPVTALVTAAVLREPLRWPGWVAVAAVVGGLALLAAGSGSPGTSRGGTGLVLAVWAVVALLVGVGGAVRRLRAFQLGLLAGVGYAGSALATRALDVPVDLLVVAAGIAVPTLGVLAFWAYSTALDRSDVAASTAPMIVTQTVVPAMIGLLALGDSIRPGWWGAVAGGLLLATSGAVHLARAEADLERQAS